MSTITEQKKQGIPNTHDKEKCLGRRPTTIDDITPVFYKHYPSYMSGTMNVSELARICGLSRPTVYKYLELIAI